MNYTEKEKKGIDKVHSMNNFFDKILMPIIGVLIIISLLIFIVGNLRDKFGGKEQNAAQASVKETSSESTAPLEFQRRRELLSNYDKYSKQFESYGYVPAEGYSQELALCKAVDEELVIYQFLDGTLGDFTILQYTPSKAASSAFDRISMTVSSSAIINASVSNGSDEYRVTFTNTDFSMYSRDDSEQYNSMMKIISTDELKALYEIFQADIENLSTICNVN